MKRKSLSPRDKKEIESDSGVLTEVRGAAWHSSRGRGGSASTPEWPCLGF